MLSGQRVGWEAEPRSAVELMEAATRFDRAAALCPAPAMKTHLAGCAARCESIRGLHIRGLHRPMLRPTAYARRGRVEARLAIPDDDLLNTLPLELQLHVANALGERCDRAALALAPPCVLGLAACRELPSYQGLEMLLAFHYVLGGAIDEQPLRGDGGRLRMAFASRPVQHWWLAFVRAAGALCEQRSCGLGG